MLRMTAKIRTEYFVKPIPLRGFDWIAVDDEPGHPIGCGSTEHNQSQTSLNKLKGVGMSFSLHLESGYRERTAHDFILPRFRRTLSGKNS